MRCINNTDKNVTVRKQKIRKNHVREKLIFFTILALILLLAAAFARKLCPYDPDVQNIYWEPTVMEEICFRVYWWEVRPVFMQLCFL